MLKKFFFKVERSQLISMYVFLLEFIKFILILVCINDIEKIRGQAEGLSVC